MRLMTRSQQAWLLDRLMARRYRAKRPAREKLSRRGLHLCADRSRCDEKSSFMRREHVRHSQRRRAFLAWAGRHAEMLGAIAEVRQSRIDMDVRFDRANSSVVFSVSATCISVTLSVDGRSYISREFDSDPRKVVGGYVDDSLTPKHTIVHPDLHALWSSEVFEQFQRWYADEFATATMLLKR
ncbi:hypothetical protein L3V59_40675 [Burkholderia aenigmatica]|uniref:hypothetical protein n=1 Tax=Burkholderia cepacia complex TaxID=87882 RepID=UPI0013DE5B3B|nr:MULTISPECIES: hypothetical protein [Burkholderia cepacia complex]UKD16968.1 hypothetical protein L3V59_40675 [Burkholderia aenigmatica]